MVKKCKMVSVFTSPDVNTREVGRTRNKRRKPRSEADGFQLILSGYVNTETILHFFYKITCNKGKRRACYCFSFGFSAVS